MRKCQNEESFENCTTRQYLERVEEECNCIPYRLRNCLIPCEGIYADVTILKSSEIDETQYESFVENYQKYKRYFDPSKGKTFLQS